MHRRAFLKLLGLAGAGATVPLQWLAGVAQASAKTASKVVAYDARLYAAGQNGRILVSDDAGATWRVHIDLGAACSVTGLSIQQKRLVAGIAFQGLPFPLVLGPDRTSWLTA